MLQTYHLSIFVASNAKVGTLNWRNAFHYILTKSVCIVFYYHSFIYLGILKMLKQQIKKYIVIKTCNIFWIARCSLRQKWFCKLYSPGHNQDGAKKVITVLTIKYARSTIKKMILLKTRFGQWCSWPSF